MTTATVNLVYTLNTECFPLPTMIIFSEILSFFRQQAITLETEALNNSHTLSAAHNVSHHT